MDYERLGEPPARLWPWPRACSRGSTALFGTAALLSASLLLPRQRAAVLPLRGASGRTAQGPSDKLGAGSRFWAEGVSGREACLNPMVSVGAFRVSEGGEAIAAWEKELDGWQLLQATDMQRHADRWLYRHDNIGNDCWPAQINSSDGRLASQCDFNRSSIWSAFKHEADPYAAPLKGHCDLMQITVSGLEHSRRLGEIFRAEYGEDGRHPLGGLGGRGCARGSVLLFSDAVQKNERTAEEVYRGLCGRPPALGEFPAEAVLADGGSSVRRGSPFWLRPGVCGGEEFAAYAREAAAAQEASGSYVREAQVLAAEAARLNRHALPTDAADYRPFLSGLIDCAVCHACLGLDDVPSTLLNSQGAPDEHGIFGRMDRMETAGVLWPYIYFRSRNESAFIRYAQLHYGYYFVVLLDRMQAAIDTARSGPAAAGGSSPTFFVQVMSDTNLSPQLLMLGFAAAAAVRPQWLATLVTELWVRGSGPEAEFSVRTLYNGRVQRPCRGQSGALCPWSEFRTLLARFAPQRQSCQRFYDNFDPVSSLWH